MVWFIGMWTLLDSDVTYIPWAAQDSRDSQGSSTAGGGYDPNNPLDHGARNVLFLGLATFGYLTLYTPDSSFLLIPSHISAVVSGIGGDYAERFERRGNVHFKRALTAEDAEKLRSVSML